MQIFFVHHLLFATLQSNFRNFENSSIQVNDRRINFTVESEGEFPTVKVKFNRTKDGFVAQFTNVESEDDLQFKDNSILYEKGREKVLASFSAQNISVKKIKITHENHATNIFYALN